MCLQLLAGKGKYLYNSFHNSFFWKRGYPMSKYSTLLAWWQSHHLRSAGDFERLLKDFNPCFSYNSYLLEGGDIEFHTVQEFFQTGTVSQFTGNPKDLFVLSNHQFCYDYLRDRVLARDELDTTMVQEVHRILTSGVYDQPLYLNLGERPGELKKQDFVTAVNAVGSPAQDVEEELDRLTEEISGYCGSELLGEAAYFHCRFEHIHPFAAGNGATGQILVNFFLLSRDHPPLVFFAQDKEEYFHCLTVYDHTKDFQPMAAFLEKELLKSWTL